MTIINVKDAGAKGNGTDNDWSVLNGLITAGAGAFYFPPGRYRINLTLEFPDKTGYHLVGCGMARPLPQGNVAVGPESVIIWGGGDGGTMIKYHGSGLVWSGLSLWGCGLAGSSSSCPAARALHGIQLSRISSTVGTGKIWFDSILIAHCDEGIATTNTSNNDNLDFGYYWCQDCDYALRLGGGQSLEFIFKTLRAADVGTIFQIDNPTGGGGGRIMTQNVIVESSDTTVLGLQGGGDNSAFHQLGGVVIDEAATGITLLDNDTDVSNSGGSQYVRFTDGHFRNDASIRVVRTEGGLTTLDLVGCRGVGQLQGSVLLKGKDSGNRAVFFVRDCDLSGLSNTSISSLIATSSNNYRAWGRDNWTFAAGKVADSQSILPNP